MTRVLSTVGSLSLWAPIVCRRIRYLKPARTGAEKESGLPIRSPRIAKVTISSGSASGAQDQEGARANREGLARHIPDRARVVGV